jgi:hypothetical protein
MECHRSNDSQHAAARPRPAALVSPTKSALTPVPRLPRLLALLGHGHVASPPLSTGQVPLLVTLAGETYDANSRRRACLTNIMPLAYVVAMSRPCLRSSHTQAILVRSDRMGPSGQRRHTPLPPRQPHILNLPLPHFFSCLEGETAQSRPWRIKRFSLPILKSCLLPARLLFGPLLNMRFGSWLHTCLSTLTSPSPSLVFSLLCPPVTEGLLRIFYRYTRRTPWVLEYNSPLVASTSNT